MSSALSVSRSSRSTFGCRVQWLCVFAYVCVGVCTCAQLCVCLRVCVCVWVHARPCATICVRGHAGHRACVSPSVRACVRACAHACVRGWCLCMCVCVSVYVCVSRKLLSHISVSDLHPTRLSTKTLFFFLPLTKKPKQTTKKRNFFGQLQTAGLVFAKTFFCKTFPAESSLTVRCLKVFSC